MGLVVNRLKEMVIYVNFLIMIVGVFFIWFFIIDYFEDWNWLVDVKYGIRFGLNIMCLMV